MKYWLIGNYSLQGLEDKVNEKIKEEWIPQGGLTSVYNPKIDEVTFSQAMIKKD